MRLPIICSQNRKTLIRLTKVSDRAALIKVFAAERREYFYKQSMCDAEYTMRHRERRAAGEGGGT